MWEPAPFLIAMTYGPKTVDGYIYRGLGLYMTVPGSPKGRRPSTWVLTHLGTGHALCRLKGDVAPTFPIATQIAECGEWDFDSLTGWKDRDPDLMDKFIAIWKSNPKVISRDGGESNEDIARSISIARAG